MEQVYPHEPLDIKVNLVYSVGMDRTKCSFYSDDSTPVNRTACSAHGNRHPVECANELTRQLDASLKVVAAARHTLLGNCTAAHVTLRQALAEYDLAERKK